MPRNESKLAAFSHVFAQSIRRLWRPQDRRLRQLPPLGVLCRLLDVAFFASLEREEGRQLSFNLCCIPSGGSALVLGKYTLIRFASPRNLTVAEIQRLAPAVSLRLACILVEWNDAGELQIVGILHIGSSWFNSRRGLGLTPEDPPNAFLVEIQGAGKLTAYVGSFRIASSSGGVVAENNGATNEQFLDALHIFVPGVQQIARRNTSALEITAYFDVITSILNGIEAEGHGGALLIGCGEWARKRARSMLKIKYRISNGTFVRDAFRAYLSERKRVLDEAFGGSDGPERLKRENDATFSEIAAVLQADSEMIAKNRALNSAVSTLAKFAGVDGALLIGADLSCCGFGCEIKIDATQRVSKARRVRLTGAQDLVDSESRGMRHRSALRLCKSCSGEVVAFVCSQDGGVNMIYGEKKTVWMREFLPVSWHCDFDPGVVESKR